MISLNNFNALYLVAYLFLMELLYFGLSIEITTFLLVRE